MNAENFAEWHRRQGHKVIQSESSWWYEAIPHVFQAFPFHWLIKPTEKEIQSLIRNHKIAALRYSCPIDAPFGKISYHIIKKSPYSLEHIERHTRKNILQGLACSEIRQIPLSRLADEGWILQKDTLERQNRLDSMSQKNWQRLCLSAEGISGFECWAAIVNDKLAAAVLTGQIENTWSTLFLLSRTEFVKMGVNHALYFSFAHEKLMDKNNKFIFFTLQSLDAPKSVDEFKFRLNLDPLAVRQRVVFHPAIKPFANLFFQNIIQHLNKGFKSNGISKLEGMINFYTQGCLPLEKQVWPECLQKQHEEFIE